MRSSAATSPMAKPPRGNPLRALPVTLLTTAIAVAAGAAGQANDLSFATPDGLFQMERAGGDRRTLVPGGDRPTTGLVWSADGQQLALVQNHGEVYRLVSSTSTLRPLFTSDCARPPSLEVVWQPSGSLVVKDRCIVIPGAPAQITLVLIDDSGTATPLDILPDTLESDAFLSPDGTEVAYVVGQHLFVAPLSGGRPRRLTQTPGTYGAAGSPLAWSPDGSRLAFYEGSYPFQRLNVVGAEGGDRRVLTPSPDFQIYRSRVLWSPDGRYLAFYRPHNPPFSNQEVVELVNVNTAETRTLTGPGFYDALSWSPDSQQLVMAFGVQASQQGLFRLNLVDQEFTALTNRPVTSLLDSQWAPDGSWIAFTAAPLDDPLDTQVLHWVRPDGTGLTALTSPDEYVYPFAWVPGF
jgi:Tol biopolymer transport system component